MDPAVDRCISPMSIWEAAIKREAGRLRAPRELAEILASEFRMLDLSASLLEAAADAVERVVVVVRQFGVLTRDRAFAAYGVGLSP